MNFNICIILFLLLSCVEKPTENELLDLGKFLSFTNLEDFDTRIEILPANTNVTDSINYGIIKWSLKGDEFTLELEPIYDRLDSIGVDISGNPIFDTIYTIHRTYNVYLENTKDVSFAGIDSLSMLFEIEVINTNPYYDTLNVLFPNFSVLEYQGLGVDNSYRSLNKLSDLLNTDINFKLRLRIQLSTGYNLSNPTANFQINKPIYKVRFRLNGHFRQ